MRNLLRCRRGSIALYTAVVLVPLIGMVGGGAELGLWYVTVEHAQTAADAAAVAGANRLLWNASDSVSVARNFAKQNGFCDGCKPFDATQSVSVDSGAGYVHVIVSQLQPTYLLRVLGSSFQTLGAQATAVVDTLPSPPCILALQGSVSFQGSETVNSPTCGLASNSTASDAISFTGNGGSINAPSFSAGGCSDTGGNQCSYTGNNKVSTYVSPIPNPMSGLDSAISALKASDFSGGPCVTVVNGKSTPTLKAYSPTVTSTTGPCYNTVPPSGALMAPTSLIHPSQSGEVPP
jgi:Flp pilus assembly protein TadG